MKKLLLSLEAKLDAKLTRERLFNAEALLIHLSWRFRAHKWIVWLLRHPTRWIQRFILRRLEKRLIGYTARPAWFQIELKRIIVV